MENISLYNKPGLCPFCNSKKTFYNATKISDDYGYAVVWCDSCLNATIISRMKITSNTITDKKVPENLIFSSINK